MKFDNVFESLMLELFDTKTEVKWVVDPTNENSYVCEFVTKNNKTYVVTVEKSSSYSLFNASQLLKLIKSDYEDMEALDDFEKEIPADFINFVNEHPEINVWSITFEDKALMKSNGQEGKSSFGITGGGDSVEVFSKVVNILKSFDYGSGILYFTASEPSRISLYDRMLGKLASVLGYKHFRYNNIKRKGIYICYK